MMFSEALEEISKIYVQGAVEFYAAQSPDPWQSAHDEMDRALRESIAKGADNETLDAISRTFYDTCEGLLYAFKTQYPNGITPKGFDVHSAFFSNNEEHAVAKLGMVLRSCHYCDSAKRLKLTRIEGVVTLICSTCEKNGWKGIVPQPK